MEEERSRQQGLWPEDGDYPRVPRGGGRTEEASPGTDLVPGPRALQGRAEPLAARMAPRDFSEFFGQEELVGEGRALRRAIEEDRISSMIFWGPPGTGKTALGRLIAGMTRSRFVELSAVTAGVSDVRKATEEAALWKSRGKRTILFIDEIHRFNKAQQDVLLPHVEKGTFVLMGATTENPFFAVNPALISRSRIFRFQSLRDEDIETILKRAIADGERGYGHLALDIEDGVIEHIIRFAKGDARIALNTLEALVDAGERVTVGESPEATPSAGAGAGTTGERMPVQVEPQGETVERSEAEEAGCGSGTKGGKTGPAVPVNAVTRTATGETGTAKAKLSGKPPEKIRITLKTAEDVTQTAPLLYDRAGDQHYDIISAYIKSIRGSDPDAAIYWLARMIKGGEDPRFIARRLVIAAAEDIGNADPMALVLAEAALRTVEHVGMPEARIPLAQATLYLACAPKSNASYLAIDKAMKDVEEKPGYPVPPHLRGTGYYGAEKLGHGVGYLYPHEFPGHQVAQQYLPAELEGTRYYEPDPQGFEKTLRERLEELRSMKKR